MAKIEAVGSAIVVAALLISLVEVAPAISTTAYVFFLVPLALVVAVEAAPEVSPAVLQYKVLRGLTSPLRAL